jgi:hypothetical protein
VQPGRHHRHSPDVIDIGQAFFVLLGRPDVRLKTRIADLEHVPGSRLAPLVAGEVPVDDVPPAGAEP